MSANNPTRTFINETIRSFVMMSKIYATFALWAGLPLLTQIGETFAGRVAASPLTAIELPELLATTRVQYVDLAVELASNSKNWLPWKILGARYLELTQQDDGDTLYDPIPWDRSRNN